MNSRISFSSFFVITSISITVFGKFTPFLEDKIDWIPIVHGYQYPFYIITVIELSYRLKWDVIKIVKFILAGTLPVASFLAEKKVRASLNSSN